MIKTFNGDAKPESLAQLERAAAARDDIEVIDRFLPVAEKDALLARADAYVSLHRAEGFGLSLAEAMLLGKPAIATGYSGNLQFMTPANSWLAGYELTPVGEGVEIYPPDALWAEPDVDHAAALMREVRAGGDEVARRAERGRRDVAAAFSPEATGAAMRARLERLAATRPVPAVGPAVNAQPLQDVRDKQAYDRGEGEAGVAQTVGGKALRAARPYTFHQREMNARVLKALEDQARRIDELEEQLRRARLGIADARRKAFEADAKLAELEPRDDAWSAATSSSASRVYGARELFEQCLRSVVEHTPPGTRRARRRRRLPDREIEAFTRRVAEEVAERLPVEYVRREQNLGFVAQHERGVFDDTAPADVVIVNSDTVVPPRVARAPARRRLLRRARGDREHAHQPRHDPPGPRHLEAPAPTPPPGLTVTRPTRGSPAPRRGCTRGSRPASGTASTSAARRSTSSAGSTTRSRPATARRSTSASAASRAGCATSPPTTSTSSTAARARSAPRARRAS